MDVPQNVAIEIELTYLAGELPAEISTVEPEEMEDIYIPEASSDPHLRLRRRGLNYEITKKKPLAENDSSCQTEQTITLEADEFSALSLTSTKRVQKKRYRVVLAGKAAEVDVFSGSLEGLVLIDFEFDTIDEKNKFLPPKCCLADVTQERFVAGGRLAGKAYTDIKTDLKRFNYHAIKS